jgi:hypothetical protein
MMQVGRRRPDSVGKKDLANLHAWSLLLDQSQRAVCQNRKMLMTFLAFAWLPATFP